MNDNDPLYYTAIGNENLTHITPDNIIHEMKEIYKINNESYICAAKIISFFYRLVNKNKRNQNIRDPTLKSTILSVYTSNGIEQQPTIEVIDQIIKVRATQLLTFKSHIDECINKSEINKNTWRDIELFKKYGHSHTGINDSTRRARNIFKTTLLTE